MHILHVHQVILMPAPIIMLTDSHHFFSNFPVSINLSLSLPSQDGIHRPALLIPGSSNYPVGFLVFNLLIPELFTPYRERVGVGGGLP